MSEMGLLQGLSTGLSKGLEGYVAERDRRDKRALAEREQQSKEEMIARQIMNDKLDAQVKIGGLLKDGGAEIAGMKTPKNYFRFKIGDTELAFNPEKKKEWSPNPLQDVQYQNAIADLKAKREKETPEGKYSAMPSEAKGKVGNITNALTSLTALEDAFSKGVQPQFVDSSTPLIGRFISDNDFTSAQRLMNEEVGRLQSGGAITSGELSNFKSLDPRAGDSDDIKKFKLQQKRAWLENKLAAFGVKKEDVGRLGFDAGKMGLLKRETSVDAPKSQLAGAGLLQTPKQSPEDAAALQWANANPKDPRAAAIKARLGAK